MAAVVAAEIAVVGAEVVVAGAEVVVAGAFGAYPPLAGVPACSPMEMPPRPPLCCTSENRDVAAAA